MDNFVPSEDPSGVEQLKRSAVIATQNVARLHRQLENEPDEFTRSRLLKLLLLEGGKLSFDTPAAGQNRRPHG